MATVKLILQQPYVYDQANDKKTKKKKLNPKETRLYCFLIIDREHIIKIKTEYVILPSEWDFKTQLKKDRVAGSIEFNKKLMKLRTDIWDKYQSIKEQQTDISFSQISQSLKEYGKSMEIPTLKKKQEVIDVLEEYITSLASIVSPLTIKKFVTLKNSLIKFIESNPRYESLTFSMINHGFLDDYRKFLRNLEPRGRQKTRPEGFQKGVLISTQEKYIKTLKIFCKYAEDRGYNKSSTYHEFSNITKGDQKRKKSDHDIVTLTLSELRQLYTYNLSDKPHLERVRDLFCFGCFTGQRWGDYSNFDKSQLVGDVWSFVSDKTKQEMQIDLTGYLAPALDILRKYNFELPKISQQKFNDYLKEAARIAKITEETKIIRYVGTQQIIITKSKADFLSSHTARRTCVSILLNDYNMNVVHVMGITGHSDIKTLQIYIKKDRSARRNAISQTKSITDTLSVEKSQSQAV